MYPNLQRSFFFDLGASSFVDALGWFVEQYAKSGIDCDHVYAWEADLDYGPLFWKDVPDNMTSKISFYSEPVVTDLGNSSNPLVMFGRSARWTIFVPSRLILTIRQLRLNLYGK